MNAYITELISSKVYIKYLFAFFAILTIFSSVDARTTVKDGDRLWRPVDESRIASRGQRHLDPADYTIARLDRAELTGILNKAPMEFTEQARSEPTVISVPRPDGSIAKFRIEESPILAPHIAAKFTEWRTFQGYGVDDPTETARFDWTDAGFHGYVLSLRGTYTIDPFQTNDRENYLVFSKESYGSKDGNFHCKVDELVGGDRQLFKAYEGLLGIGNDFVHGAQLRTYRLAVATTYEYTQFFRQAGDTNAQAQTRAFAQVVTTINRVNAVYRKELSVSFTLVSDTNLTYAVNPETPSNYINDGDDPDLNANQVNINSVIGSANYDVGHLFETGDGGLASLRSVCGSSKARGLSGLPNPVGDPFDVDYVAHELGHQFGANHTFNATSDCGSSPAAARKEPGSAVTIMGYAGICDSIANVQRNSIDIFHVHSLTESINFITNGNGSQCGTLSGTNATPVIAPLSNFTIPFNTPFSLTASATDADGDPLTYNWEQNDASTSTSNYPSTTDDDDVSLVFRPGFRSYLPTAEPTRSFPSLPYILDHANEAPVAYNNISATGSVCDGNCITGEDLPSAARTMNFRVSVRDGRGGITDAGTVVTVVNTTTPFKVTSQNSSPAVWTGNTQQNVTWDVSGTNANGINAANVKISMSTNGGQTFTHVLAESTPNDGSAAVTIPNVATTQARIKVEAVGNIFFDINDVNFQVVTGTQATVDAPYDFDGDGKTDVSVFRPSVGEWWYLRSSDQVARGFQFGAGTDAVAAADYTGDGKADVAFFRPTSGEWFILRSEDSSFYAFPFGAAGDVAMPGDYDGDGKADPAVFRPSTGNWFILRSSDQGVTVTHFGQDGDRPATGDFDGDGKTDAGIFRPSVGEWWYLRSSDQVARGFQFGSSTDKTVVGDYTGDGKADVAFFRPASGEWFILRSEDSSFYAFPFGNSTDIPAPGDYDGDGKTDPAVFRPSTGNWFVLGSTAGVTATHFGQSGDSPVPAATVR